MAIKSQINIGELVAYAQAHKHVSGDSKYYVSHRQLLALFEAGAQGKGPALIGNLTDPCEVWYGQSLFIHQCTKDCFPNGLRLVK